MLALDKHNYLGSFYEIIPSGATPKYIPIHDCWKPSYGTSDSLSVVRAPLAELIPFPWDPNLAWIVRDTTPTSYIMPSLTRGPPLQSLSRSLDENPLRSQPCVDHKRHGTYILHYSISLIHSWKVKPVHA